MGAERCKIIYFIFYFCLGCIYLTINNVVFLVIDMCVRVNWGRGQVIALVTFIPNFNYVCNDTVLYKFWNRDGKIIYRRQHWFPFLTLASVNVKSFYLYLFFEIRLCREAAHISEVTERLITYLETEDIKIGHGTPQDP